MNSISNRINRIIGQLRGVQKMTESKRDCAEILQQISALKKAIDGLSKELAVSDICRFASRSQAKNIEKVVERVINL